MAGVGIDKKATLFINEYGNQCKGYEWRKHKILQQ
jgi:hypothetical protein